MPSPMAQRIAPTISDDIKKRIQSAVRTKEKKIKKEIITDVDVSKH